MVCEARRFVCDIATKVKSPVDVEYFGLAEGDDTGKRSIIC